MTRRTIQLLTAFALCLPIASPTVGVPTDYPCTGPGPGGKEVCHNGLQLNARTLNGLQVNGLMANGLQVNGVNTKSRHAAGAPLVARGGRLFIE